ncbi:hypothetical protein [Streptomyces sp. NRRL S-4]|uniref:hypothetical protein n=1 Tax=Streptomyces sp. NRRL S-4 TaxID=1519471 RepID=UPI0006B681CD|nr:hypothetical protein [Streptomyces sp. NRRL S-4]KPC82022.1 hypothetical protein ADK82_11845 [Streptomyces sp. NRRL S-4]
MSTQETGGTSGSDRSGKGAAKRQVVRHLPGPFLTRVCIRTDDGFRWGESLRAASPAYLDAEALGAVARSVAVTPAAPYAVMPTLADACTSVHAEVPTPALLSDVVFTGDGCARSWVQGAFRHLGAFLAHLHAVSTEGEALPVRRRAAWLDAEPAVASGIQEARSLLARTVPPGTALSGRPDSSPPCTGPGTTPAPASTLVHGRLSTASCVPGPVPRVLGWREAGVGDPMGDLAYLLRDLVQSAAGTGDTGAKAGCAKVAVAGYEEARDASLTPCELARLASATASCVLDHAALRAWAASDQPGALALLRRADRVLPEILAAVGYRRVTTA